MSKQLWKNKDSALFSHLSTMTLQDRVETNNKDLVYFINTILFYLWNNKWQSWGMIMFVWISYHPQHRKRMRTGGGWCHSSRTWSSCDGKTFPRRWDVPWRRPASDRRNTRRCRRCSEETPSARNPAETQVVSSENQKIKPSTWVEDPKLIQCTMNGRVSILAKTGQCTPD